MMTAKPKVPSPIQVVAMRKMQDFLNDESGATAIEYGLMSAIIFIGLLATLTSLNGHEFEVEILKELIRHHAAGVTHGTENTWKSYHGELRQLTRNAISVWSRDVCIMQQWLCRWHQVGE